VNVQSLGSAQPLVIGSARKTSVLARRLRSCMKWKLLLYLVLTIVFCIPYFTIQRAAWLQPHIFSLGYIDQAIGFHPGAIYLYQSVYLLLPVFPFLAETRHELALFAKGFLLLCLVCFAVFLVFPVLGPRPQHAIGNRMMELLYSYDKNLNTFPSLHAGLAVYSAFFGFSLSRNCQELRWLVMAGTIWAVAILISTVATRQHYFVDIPPAIALAWIAHRWVWSRS
jgi:membrane-associated phospholipid phosphatase